MNLGKLCRMLLPAAAALLILSGCANQQKAENAELLYTEGGNAPVDLGSLSTLSSAEKKAISNTSKLDKNLSPSMEAQVRYHFLKYARQQRGTMENFLRNSIPYLNYTKSVFRSRGLPEDLAYLAYLESGYNPMAVSRSNAVGMWQFISSTGKNFGLQQDWWMDERRDPYRSTEAAADYLARLYSIFHDWHLAVASYNGGEGKISRAKNAAGADSLHEIIQNNNKLDYNLQLREETMLYVPRFLAISRVMRSANTLGIQPSSPDADHPVLVPVSKLTAKPATDLVELSRRIGMSWKEFLAYNPHILRSVSPANRSCFVYVPKNKESQARTLLRGSLSGAGWRYYTVARGESLSKVSSRTGIPTSIISQLNPGKIQKGKTLRLPASGRNLPAIQPSAPAKNTAIASNTPRKNSAKESYAQAALAELRSKSRALPPTYKVKSGDTLFSIAKAHNIEVRDLYAANGGSGKLAALRAGQVIYLAAPAQVTAAAPAAVPSRNTSSHMGFHTVQSGESAYAISRKYGISFQDLCDANGGSGKLLSLSPGQRLNIPLGKYADAKNTAAAPKKAPAKSSSVTAEVYRVQNGETLWSISRKFNMKPTELLALNGMDHSTRVKVGDTLKVIRYK